VTSSSNHCPLVMRCTQKKPAAKGLWLGTMAFLIEACFVQQAFFEVLNDSTVSPESFPPFYNEAKNCGTFLWVVVAEQLEPLKFGS